MKTKERIFEAALTLFSKKGFKATTIREITKLAGISPGSFYNHFVSKEELLQAVYDYYSGLYIHPQNAEQPPDFDQLLAQYGPAELFTVLTNRYIDAMRNEKLARLTKIILIEQYTNPVAGEIAFRDRQHLLDSMEALFVLMHRHGYINAKDPQTAGRQLGYLYLGFSADNTYYFFTQKQDPAEIAARQNRIIQQFVSGYLIAE